MIHVDSDSGDGNVRRIFLGAHFYEHARDLASIELNVIWRFDGYAQRELFVDRARHRCRGPRREPRRFVDVDLGAEQN